MTSSTELLFVCASTKEGWPINIYDSQTGNALWSYRGSELQGEMPGQSILIADEYVVSTVLGRPVLSHVSMQSKNRTHFRSFTSGVVQCLAVTQDGTICSGAIGEKIHTWMISNGSLTSVVSGHYQAINKLKFTSDGTFLISGGKDGRILAWNMVELLSPENSTMKKQTSSTKCWSAHSLPITDMKVGFGGVDCRIFTVSLDQSAKIHSLISGQLLMTLIFDCALSACGIDDAETRLFIGTVKGDILQINLFMQPAARERHIQTIVESTEYPVFIGHKQRITELCVNIDSTLLASGSEDKTVRIWHINSRQCLRTISSNGNVTTVQFIPSLPIMMDKDYICSHPVQAFQKQLRSVEAQGQMVIKLKKSIGGQNELGLPNEKEIERMLKELKNEEDLSNEIDRPLGIIEEIRPEESGSSKKKKKRKLSSSKLKIKNSKRLMRKAGKHRIKH